MGFLMGVGLYVSKTNRLLLLFMYKLYNQDNFPVPVPVLSSATSFQKGVIQNYFWGGLVIIKVRGEGGRTN